MTYDAYKFQKGLLNSYHNYRFSISMLGRQMGKSTTGTGYLLWYAMFNADQTILIGHTNIRMPKRLCIELDMHMNYVPTISEQV